GAHKEEAPSTPAPVDTQAPATKKQAPAIKKIVPGMVRSTPVARRLARLNGLKLDEIVGSGRRERIEKIDVESALSAQMAGKIQFSQSIAYTSHGPVTGKQYLMVHGFSGDHSTFAGLANALSRAGCRAVALDLPGHGATRLEAKDSNALSTNLEEFAAKVMGAPFHLIAHSLGAVPALELASVVLPASVTLIAPAGLGLKLDREFIFGMADPTSVDQVRHLLLHLTDRPSGLSDAAIKGLYDELAKGRLKALAASLFDDLGQTQDIKPVLENIASKIPVRVLIGHRDRIIDWQDACDLPSNVAVHHFSNGGHLLHWDQPKEVLKILLQGVHDEQNS
ncbi:MAG: alpha/beta fold hydrolase, partial [Devosiaceae bacterium]|nr:alpha/beta fold hydrolase [Devosiaceae bacterium]